MRRAPASARRAPPGRVPSGRVPSEEKEPGKNLVRDFLIGFFLQFRDEILLVVAGTIAAFVRAMGVTVESGQTGLLFSFGRARRELVPGFHLLVPFLQRASKVPTRSRTLDLPAQRVVTLVGLVYHVDANLVYRITDVRKALIEIDDLEKGMRQMLGLGVQEVVRASQRQELTRSSQLDDKLCENLSRRLAPWGVEVERAGLTSISPSRQTLRITQIERVTAERRTMFGKLTETAGERGALALIGTRKRFVRRHLHLRSSELRARRVRRLRQALMQRGWMAVQIKSAAQRLRARSTTGGRLKAENRRLSRGGAEGPAERDAGRTRSGTKTAPDGRPTATPRRKDNAPRRGGQRNAPPGPARKQQQRKGR